MADLMTDLAEVITDLRRMTYDNDDPMRYSKRQAKALAEQILSRAVEDARRALELPGLIGSDFAAATVKEVT